MGISRDYESKVALAFSQFLSEHILSVRKGMQAETAWNSF